MAKSVRYYITSDDDRAVVRSVPVSIRQDDAHPDVQPRAETPAAPTRDGQKPARVARLVRSAVRRSPVGR